MTSRTQARPGFTLVELLVVIAIIAILVSLTTAAVQKVREQGRNVQARSDIQQLVSSIGQFKARFGVYPPCYGSHASGAFILRTDYSTTALQATPEYVLLKQMFPRMSPGDNGLRKNAAVASNSNLASAGFTGTTNQPIYLDPNQSLVVFLSGGTFTDYQGFSTIQTAPFTASASGSTSSSRLNGGALWSGFEGNSSRKILPKDYLNSADRFAGDNADSKDQPWFVDPWGTPYLYFCSSLGNDYPFDSTGFSMKPWSQDSASTYGTTIKPFRESSTRFVEMRAFQIVSGGRNKFFGPGGSRANGGSAAPGTGNYALNRIGGDDYSNFQTAPLGVTD